MNLRLFVQVLSIEVRKLMSYRTDFWLSSVVGFLAHFGVAYFLWRAIFRESDQTVIAGYSFDGMVLYYVMVILVGKMVRGSDHMADISQDIYEGSLSRYIVYPTSYFQFKYAQNVGLMAPALVQLAIFSVAYALVLPFPAEVHITPLSIGMTVISVSIANLLWYVHQLPVQAVAFWADNVWSLVVMFRFVANLVGGAALPLALFPEWAQRLLVFLPFRYLFDFPVSTLTGRIGVDEWLLGVGVASTWIVMLGLVTRLVWRRGMLSYTGVGI